jgi:hypothetical protein
MLSVFGFTLEIIRIDSAFCEERKTDFSRNTGWLLVGKLYFASKSWFDYE